MQKPASSSALALFGACAIGAWCAAVAAPAHADPTARAPIVLDAIRVEPSPLPGRAMLQLLVRANDAIGTPVVLADAGGASAWRISIGQRTVETPVIVTRAPAAEIETALAVVIATTTEFAPSLPAIISGIREQVLATLRKDDRVAVVAYASTLGGASRLVAPAQAQTALDALAPEDAWSTPVFADAVERAIAAVERYRPVAQDALVHRLVIIVSDGQDAAIDRERITALAQRAARKQVRVLAVAHTPSGSKGPLLNLGELAKHSLGTLRWVRTNTEQAFREQLARVAAELTDGYVLTAFIPPPPSTTDVRVTARIGQTEATSNALPWRAPACGEPCKTTLGICASRQCVDLTTHATWSARIRSYAPYTGGVLAVVALGAGAAFAMRRRRRMIAPASVPGQRWQCIHGPLQGQIVQVAAGDVVGKHQACEVRLRDPMVSDRHATIRLDAHGQLVLCDLNSTNGTFVGGVRVTQAPVRVGSVIGLGPSQWRVVG